MNEKCSTLAKKLAAIVGAIGKVEKTGRNDFHKYDYVTENDLVYAVRGKLSEAGIFVFTSVETQNVQIIRDDTDPADVRLNALTTVSVRHTFVDGETGESFSVMSQGQGVDVGDKGGYKAMTGAMKYFIYKNFLIPTGDDPEGDTRVDQRAAGRRAVDQRPPATSARPTAQPGASVPRSTSTVDQHEQFEQGKWEKVKIGFGQYKGTSLGELSGPQMKAWQEWQPKPYNGKISEDDRIMRIALDVAAKELGIS